MSGQKGPLYKQAGVAIPNRTPFNKNIPNKRQTINDGLAYFASFDSGSGDFQLTNTLPFLQDAAPQFTEILLFGEDAPTRLRLDQFADTAYSRVFVGSPLVAYSFPVPAMSLSTPGVLLGTPTIIDGYTAYTASNGVGEGEIAKGTTITNGVKVRGYSALFYDPIVAQVDVRFSDAGMTTPTAYWESSVLDFSTRSTNTNGYCGYNGSGLDFDRSTLPIVLEEGFYTQAMQDANNTFQIGNTTMRIVGITATYPQGITPG